MSKKRHKEELIFDQNKIRFYYGIPHCHSSYSTGKGTPAELYEHAAKCGLHFLIITDHNHYLSNKLTIKENILTRWQATNYYSARAKKNFEDFLPMVGFESRTTSYGDFNIINTKNFFTGSIDDLRVLTLWMINNPNSFVSINHPHKNIASLPYDPVFNKIITSIEVCNGNPAAKVTRHDKYYFLLLDHGWKLGAINGQDNHRLNFDESENLTVYIGNSLSKDSLVEAFRERRTYSTESRFLRFYFTINQNFMGETLTITSPKLKFMIYAEDIRYKIKSIQVITNSGATIKTIDNINLNNIKYIYEHIPKDNESWYVIKIIQDDGRTALSSPIFVNNENSINESD